MHKLLRKARRAAYGVAGLGITALSFAQTAVYESDGTELAGVETAFGAFLAVGAAIFIGVAFFVLTRKGSRHASRSG